ncbi:MAG: lipid-transfer protein [Acidimicrobiia bacterium]|nr:lipid-transfer protein [Acidimicrobiia bacterium]
MSAPWDGAAIAGIGQTEFSQNSGRSERRLAVEAITTALADAGLTANDVDGLVTFDFDSNDPASVADTMGLRQLTFFSETMYGGGGGCSTIMQAAMAVASGSAEVVVAYRAMNERSGVRFGQARVSKRAIPAVIALSAPYGLHTAAQGFSLNIARYFHEHDVTNADVAPLAVAQRAYAATNPAARFFGRPITIDDHQSSRWIVEPVLRLYDCCLESDGAVAIVVTSADRARHLRNAPVAVRAAAQGLAGQQMRNWYRPSIGSVEETRVAGDRLWAASGLGPSDMQVAILYDHFLPMVLMQLEALGFCKPGEAKHFIADGNRTVAINTNGGLTGEAYLHGMNWITEAVRQLRGTAANQVRDVEHVLVTSGPGVPTSALVLARSERQT